MNTYIELSALSAMSAGHAAPVAGRKKHEEFSRVLKRLGDYMESTEKAEAEKADDIRAAMETKDKQKRINELKSLIAQLREKLPGSEYNEAILAQIAMAQTELSWLQFNL